MKAFLLTLALPLLALPALAQDATPMPTTVYELFTSQGCSSCPPANADIARLAEDPDVLALSYGVTYWDYLGWKDTFARPEFTERQRNYVKALGGRNAYTPQIVMNGRRHDSRAAKLKAYETVGDAVSFHSLGKRVEARGSGKAVLVSFTPGAQNVPVARGENGGRTLSITNVVSDMESVTLPHRFTPDAGLAYALLQHGKNDRIDSAAVHYPDRN